MKKNALYMLLVASQHAVLTQAIDSHILHQTTMARYSVAKKDYTTAKNRYFSIFKNKQYARVPVYAYRGYLLYLYELGHFQEIVALRETVESSYQHDPEILLLLAQSLAHVGRIQESSHHIIDLSKRFKDHPEIIFSAVQTYLSLKEPRKALESIETFLNTPPHRPSDRIFSLLKSQIHAQLNEHHKALDTIQTCLELYPTFDHGWLFYAMLQEQKESIDLAIKGYKTFLEVSDRPHKEIEQHIFKLTLKKSLKKQRKKTLDISHSAMETAIKRFGNKEYQPALDAINEWLQEHPNHTDGRLMKIQLLTTLKRLREAVQLLTLWAQEDPKNSIWFETMHIVCRVGLTYQEAYTATQQIAYHAPQTLLSQLYLADYATRLQDYQQAVEHCNLALTLTESVQLKKTLYFHLGMLHYDQGDVEKAITVLEQGAQLPIAHAPLHNLLAYCYATHTKNSKAARAHSTQALAIDPENAHYLDTQATILCLEGEYQKAEKLLESAHKKDPTNSTILEHLAQTLYKQKQYQKAYTYLQQAEKHAKKRNDRERLYNLRALWDSNK